jgi:hypothetical protein
MRAFFSGLVFAIVALASGCSNAGPVSSVEASLAGGCRVICPHCHPGEVCPLVACYEDCNAADPHSCVDTQLCVIGYHWDAQRCSCVP